MQADRATAHIEVVAAVIRRGGRIFATQRGYGEFKDWWEFPGGKMEPGETPQQALVREIREELDTDISVGSLIRTVEWDYPSFHLTMHCFWCTLASPDSPPPNCTCSSTKPPDGSPRTTSSPSAGSPPTKESCRTSASDSDCPHPGIHKRLQLIPSNFPQIQFIFN